MAAGPQTIWRPVISPFFLNTNSYMIRPQGALSLSWDQSNPPLPLRFLLRATNDPTPMSFESWAPPNDTNLLRPKSTTAGMQQRIWQFGGRLIPPRLDFLPSSISTRANRTGPSLNTVAISYFSLFWPFLWHCSTLRPSSNWPSRMAQFTLSPTPPIPENLIPSGTIRPNQPTLHSFLNLFVRLKRVNVEGDQQWPITSVEPIRICYNPAASPRSFFRAKWHLPPEHLQQRDFKPTATQPHTGLPRFSRLISQQCIHDGWVGYHFDDKMSPKCTWPFPTSPTLII